MCGIVAPKRMDFFKTHKLPDALYYVCQTYRIQTQFILKFKRLFIYLNLLKIYFPI